MGVSLSCCSSRDHDLDFYDPYRPHHGPQYNLQPIQYYDAPPVQYAGAQPAPAEYWPDWLALERATLPVRQAQFDSKLDLPFVQITRDNAATFYNLEPYEMNQVLPRRPFVHNGVHGNAYEHRAVRRMAYFRMAYLTGYNGNEEQMYRHGQNVFNQRLDAAAARGQYMEPIVLFSRNNNQDYNYEYSSLHTRGDLRAHERFD